MKKINSSKVMSIFLGLLISFLAIFIVSMLARSFATNILPENSRISLFINDYVDMMTKKVDNIALRMKIKRNTVSQYQVDLINQSIDDYVNYSMFKSANAVSSYNPNIEATSTHIEKYKNEYYKMTLENPYLKSMTLFNTDGEMRLNLYSSESKSWPLELDKKLISNLKIEGSLVLNASNENAFYIMQYLRNRSGEFIVATRNDYAYVSDIAMYYQVADKSLYVNDSQNMIYNIPEGIASISIDPVSSVIGKYAYYKKQPSFIDNNAELSVTLFGREYPNYFELIVLAITAFFIVVLQYLIRGIIYLFAQLTGLKRANEDYISLPKSDVPMIDDNIVSKDLPQSIKYEDIDLSDHKVVHKIDEELIYPKDDHKAEIDLLYSEEVHKMEGINLNKIPRFSFDEKLKDDVAESSLDFYGNSESTENEVNDDNFDDIYSDKVEMVSEYDEIETIKEELANYTYSDDTDDIIEEITYNEKIDASDIFNIGNSNEITNSDENSVNSDASSNNEDVFLAFDKMLASILDKVESETKDSLNKKV